MATNVRVETIPGITSTNGALKPPALNGVPASNGAGSQSHLDAAAGSKALALDGAAGSSDPRPVVRCDRCRLVQFRASHNRCRRCLMPFVVAAPPPPEPVVEAEAHPDIAAGVRAWRQQRGLTQKQLAFAAHLPRTYISRIENGRILPGLSTLERVAGALHLGLAALLDRRARNGCSGAHNGHGNGNGYSNGNGTSFIPDPSVYDTANGNGNGNSHALPNAENEAFLRQMVRYCRRMTVVQRTAVLERVRQLATAH